MRVSIGRLHSLTFKQLPNMKLYNWIEQQEVSCELTRKSLSTNFTNLKCCNQYLSNFSLTNVFYVYIFWFVFQLTMTRCVHSAGFSYYVALLTNITDTYTNAYTTHSIARVYNFSLCLLSRNMHARTHTHKS